MRPLPPSPRALAVLLMVSLALALPARQAAAQRPRLNPPPIFSILWYDISPDSSSAHATVTNAASGGRVNGLASSRDRTNMIAASEWGGLWRSRDSGSTWLHVDTHTPMATWAVAIDPTDARRVYATSFYDGRVTSRAGINVSTDGGDSWAHPVTAVNTKTSCADTNRINNPSAFGISISKRNPRTVVVGTNCGVMRTDDRGTTWRQIFHSVGNVWSVVIHDSTIIDLCGDDGHRRSVNGGASWTTASSAPLPAGPCSIAAGPGNPQLLIATVQNTLLFQSVDGGASWQPFSVATNSPDQGEGRMSVVQTNARANGAFDLWYGYAWLYRAPCQTAQCPVVVPSQGPGPNFWTEVGYHSGAHNDPGVVLFDPAAGVDACPLLMSNDGGIERNTITTSPACQTPKWVQPMRTPHALWVRGMELTETLSNDSTAHDTSGVIRAVPFGGVNTYRRIIFGTQDNGSFQTNRADATKVAWINTDPADASDAVGNATTTINSICCYGVQSLLFLRQIGPGAIMSDTTAHQLPLPGGRQLLHSDHAIALTRENHFAALTDSGLVATPDVLSEISPRAPRWTLLGWPTASLPGPSGLASLYVSSDASGPVFYVRVGAPSMAAQVWKLSGARFYKSSITPEKPEVPGTWTQIRPPGDSGGFGVFAVDRAAPNLLLAEHRRPGLDSRMMRSVDGGATWIPLPALDACMTRNGAFRYSNVLGPTGIGFGADGFGGYYQPTLVAFGAPADSGRLLLAGAADAGIFASLDAGVSWYALTETDHPYAGSVPQIPRPSYMKVSDGPDGSLLYFGSQGRGIWRIFFPRVPRLTIHAPSC